MSDDDNPRDLAMIASDEQLLDLLAAGGEPQDGDEVAAMLAAWRAEVGSDLPTVRRAAPRSAGAPARPRRDRSRRVSRSTRILLSSAAVLLALAGTVSVLASHARPDSPLWPITRVLYADWAESAVAEQEAQESIDDARQALANSQYSDAERLLDDAAEEAQKVRDPGVAQRLLDEIDALRGLLPGLLPTSPTSAPASPGPPSPTPPGGGPGTAPTTAPGGILPSGILPTCLLPSLPLLPLPTCIHL